MAAESFKLLDKRLWSHPVTGKIYVKRRTTCKRSTLGNTRTETEQQHLLSELFVRSRNPFRIARWLPLLLSVHPFNYNTVSLILLSTILRKYGNSSMAQILKLSAAQIPLSVYVSTRFKYFKFAKLLLVSMLCLQFSKFVHLYQIKADYVKFSMRESNSLTRKFGASIK